MPAAAMRLVSQHLCRLATAQQRRIGIGYRIRETSNQGQWARATGNIAYLENGGTIENV